jgi:hypothetical protein
MHNKIISSIIAKHIHIADYEKVQNITLAKTALTPSDTWPIDLENLEAIEPSYSFTFVNFISANSPVEKELIRLQAEISDSLGLLQDTFWKQDKETFHTIYFTLDRIRKVLSQDDYQEHKTRVNSHKEAIMQEALALAKSINLIPSQIVYRGLLITPDGTILAKGYPTDQAQIDFRAELSNLIGERFGDLFPDAKRQNTFFHTTLGRITSSLNGKDFDNITKYILAKKDHYIGTVNFNPILARETGSFLTKHEAVGKLGNL